MIASPGLGLAEMQKPAIRVHIEPQNVANEDLARAMQLVGARRCGATLPICSGGASLTYQAAARFPPLPRGRTFFFEPTQAFLVVIVPDRPVRLES